MLAEERYRKQREEAEKDQGETIPTSPSPSKPFNVMKAEAESSTQKVEQPQVTLRTQQETPKEPEAKQKLSMLPKETAETLAPPKSPQTQPKQKPPAHFQISKPSFPKVGKKTTTESSSTALDKKQASTTAALEIKSNPAPAIHAVSVAEQVESTKTHSVKQESIQATKNIQSQTTASAQAEEIKSRETCVAQEVKKVISQTTKIPKVTPSFKVKTFKVS